MLLHSFETHICARTRPVLGILTCYYSGRPGGDFFVGIAPRIALTYSAVGITMNVLCSSLICWYIIHEMTLGRLDGVPLNRGAVNAVTIIVESMLPYTLFGVAYVTLLGLDSPVAILFLSLYVMFMVRLEFVCLWFLFGVMVLMRGPLAVPLAADDHVARPVGPRMEERQATIFWAVCVGWSTLLGRNVLSQNCPAHRYAGGRSDGVIGAVGNLLVSRSANLRKARE